MAQLIVDPPQGVFFPPHEKPSRSIHNLVNPTACRVAIKVKCSDIQRFRIIPVFAIIEPGQAATLQVSSPSPSLVPLLHPLVSDRENGRSTDGQGGQAGDPVHGGAARLPGPGVDVPAGRARSRQRPSSPAGVQPAAEPRAAASHAGRHGNASRADASPACPVKPPTRKQRTLLHLSRSLVSPVSLTIKSPVFQLQSDYQVAHADQQVTRFRRFGRFRGLGVWIQAAFLGHPGSLVQRDALRARFRLIFQNKCSNFGRILNLITILLNPLWQFQLEDILPQTIAKLAQTSLCRCRCNNIRPFS